MDDLGDRLIARLRQEDEPCPSGYLSVCLPDIEFSDLLQKLKELENKGIVRNSVQGYSLTPDADDVLQRLNEPGPIDPVSDESSSLFDGMSDSEIDSYFDSLWGGDQKVVSGSESPTNQGSGTGALSSAFSEPLDLPLSDEIAEVETVEADAEQPKESAQEKQTGSRFALRIDTPVSALQLSKNELARLADADIVTVEDFLKAFQDGHLKTDKREFDRTISALSESAFEVTPVTMDACQGSPSITVKNERLFFNQFGALCRCSLSKRSAAGKKAVILPDDLPPVSQEKMALEIADLELGHVLKTFLLRRHFVYVGDLYEVGADGLLGLRGFGAKKLKELLDVLSRLGETASAAAGAAAEALEIRPAISDSTIQQIRACCANAGLPLYGAVGNGWISDLAMSSDTTQDSQRELCDWLFNTIGEPTFSYVCEGLIYSWYLRCLGGSGLRNDGSAAMEIPAYPWWHVPCKKLAGVLDEISFDGSGLSFELRSLEDFLHTFPGDSRDRDMLAMRLDGETLETIAERFDLTKGRVGQILDRILRSCPALKENRFASLACGYEITNEIFARVTSTDARVYRYLWLKFSRAGRAKAGRRSLRLALKDDRIPQDVRERIENYRGFGSLCDKGLA